MNKQFRYQLRIYLTDALADIARHDHNNRVLQPLTDILNKHHATMVSQFDAFEAYVAEAEKVGPEKFPLYKWTKATVEDPEKRGRHIPAFALRISGEEVYTKQVADALEADLQPFIGGELVARMSRHDTNPVNNLPVPPEYQA